MSIVDQIDHVLPQTQCEECGYKGCRPYANALATGDAEINLCPPGGTEGLIKLAKLLGKDHAPFLAEVEAKTRAPSLAKINEQECIGCTKCIQACPVDAILGANKQMHSVIDFECTGCGLCVEPCPVDCIELVPLAEPLFNKDTARERFENRNKRLERHAAHKKETYEQESATNSLENKQAYILKALERAKARGNNE